MLKIIIPSVLIASILILSWVTGIKASNNKGKITIEFWTMQLSPILDDYILSSIDEYELENPNITVKWVDAAWADMEKKLLSSVAAGTAPDVANLNPQFSSKLAEFGALEDPEEYLGTAIVRSYFPKVWDSNRLRGITFGVPWYLSTNIAIYNRSIFEAADVPFPQSIEEIPEIGRKIKQATGAYTYFPGFDGGETLENYVLLGGVFDEDIPGSGLSKETVQRLLSFYFDLYDSGAVPPSVLIEGHQKSIDLFQSGELAMLLSGSQMLRTIELNAPELMKDIAVAPHPNASFSQTNIAAMNLVVPKQSEAPQQAFDFIAFITSPDKQAQMAKEISVLPSTPQSLTDPFFLLTNRDDAIESARAYSIEQIRAGDVLLPPMMNYSRLRTAFILQTQRTMLDEISLEEGTQKLMSDWSNISRMSNE